MQFALNSSSLCARECLCVCMRVCLDVCVCIRSRSFWSWSFVFKASRHPVLVLLFSFFINLPLIRRWDNSVGNVNRMSCSLYVLCQSYFEFNWQEGTIWTKWSFDVRVRSVRYFLCWIPAFLIFIPITIIMAKVGANSVHKIKREIITKLFGLFLVLIASRFLYDFINY